MSHEPQFAICEFTTLRSGFAEDLAAYAAAGASGIGVVEFKLRDGDEDRLRESGLQATVCIPSIPSILPLPPGPTVAGPTEPAERIEALCTSIRRLARLDPVAVMFFTGPGPERRGVVVEGVKRLADAAAEEGVMLAIEPFHPSLRDAYAFVNTIDDALELLADADADNVRLLFDTWQLGETPGIEEQIRKHVALFASVHVADRREPTRGAFDRVLPGHGVLPLQRLFRAFDDAGYEGFYEIEIFSDDGAFGDSLPDSFWELSADEAASRARKSFDRVWAQR